MNLLITGAWKDAKNYISEIESRGHEVCFMQWEMDELPCEPSWVEGFIGSEIFLHHDIKKFTSLRYMQLTSAGYDRVPMDYIQEHGIEIYNAKAVYSKPMAEFAISGVLQLYKQSRYFYENQKVHKWEKRRDLIELNGKSVLIIGCGDVGKECAKLFKAFGCEVIGLNRTVSDSMILDNKSFDAILPLGKIDEELSKADIVILSIAITEQTYHLLNEERLKQLKPTAVLVNVARGAIVDEQVLIDILPNIGGAVLDVFEEEPLGEDSSLWEMENVIVTPHNSFIGNNCANRLAKQIMETVKKND